MAVDVAREAPHESVASTAVGRWALPAAAVLFFAWQAWSRRWMTDDGYINIRVVEQMLAGNGPVFNAGERVEATTSTLWLYLIAAPSALLPVEPSVIAVVLGWVFGVGAMVLAVAGAHRLATAAGLAGEHSIPLPFGLLVVLGVTQFSDFATAGLEGGLTLCWLAACFFGLTLHLAGDRPCHRPGWLPVVIGLGWLVRPDAALYSVAFGIVLLVIARRSIRSIMLTLALAGVLPLGYQVFRMGYYAAVVPNTALAKNAGGSLWSFGLNYVLEFVRHYALLAAIVPLAMGLVVIVARMARHRAWRAVVLTGGVEAAALLHTAYIVKVGGDFMFGRFLLPPMFAMVLPLAVICVGAPALRRWAGLGLAIVLVWAFYAGATVKPQRFYGHGVQDERFIYTGWTPSGSTLRPWEWAGFGFYENGFDIARAHARGEHWFQEADGTRYPVADGYDLVVTHNVMGIVSVTAGTGVTIVDNLALTDPIAARVDVTERVARVGHVSHPPAYRIARYAAPSDADGPEVVAAREALACGLAQRLEVGITAPLTPALFASNVLAAPRLSLFTLDEDPMVARRQMCGTGAVDQDSSSKSGPPLYRR